MIATRYNNKKKKKMAAQIQWNPDITICQGGSKIISLCRGIVISGFRPIHFTIAGT